MRLIQQTMAENTLLSAVGGVCAAGLAYALLKLLVKAALQGISQLAQGSLDLRVLVVTLLCSVASGLIFGLGPALAMQHRQTRSSNRSTANVGGGLRQALIVAQRVFCLALLTSRDCLYARSGHSSTSLSEWTRSTC